jgi:hypothetical protein
MLVLVLMVWLCLVKLLWLWFVVRWRRFDSHGRFHRCLERIAIYKGSRRMNGGSRIRKLGQYFFQPDSPIHHRYWLMRLKPMMLWNRTQWMPAALTVSFVALAIATATAAAAATLALMVIVANGFAVVGCLIPNIPPPFKVALPVRRRCVTCSSGWADRGTI